MHASIYYMLLWLDRLIYRGSQLLAIGAFVVAASVALWFGFTDGFRFQAAHPEIVPELYSRIVVPLPGETVLQKDHLYGAEFADVFTLGMPVTRIAEAVELSRWWHDVFTVTREGVLTSTYVVYDQNSSQMLELSLGCAGVCRVEEIQIYSELFVSRGGVRVGGSIADIQSEFSITSIGYERGMFVVDTKEGIRFLLNGYGWSGDMSQQNLEAKDIPRHADIRIIVLSQR